MFLRDLWYAAAWDHIVRRPERRLLDLKIDSGGVYQKNYRAGTGAARLRRRGLNKTFRLRTNSTFF
jgi:hypothetical protein